MDSEHQRSSNKEFSNRLITIGLIVVLGLLIYLSINVFVKKPQDDIHSDKKPKTDLLADGKLLYENHCLQCHGTTGDGNGPAAKFLYPKPRNFRESKFRVVSTVNHIPSDQDLFQVITRGMPGSAMVAFGHLSETDRKALAIYIRQLNRNGLFDKQKAQLGEDTSPAELEELAKDVEQFLQPGEPLAIPGDLPAPSADSIARGAQLYRSEACANCHGATGKGDGVQNQEDDLGIPIRPRDFTLGIFKGGHETSQLFTRIMLGMPGTPMPSVPKLTTSETGDLINFVLSLSSPEIRVHFEHKRNQLVAKRIKGTLNGDIASEDWIVSKAVSIVVSPLWWRSFEDPDLQVGAIHDGKTLAIRLSWIDSTCNDRPVRPQDFEDMAAVQLFKGKPEPFLGMGAGDKPVDFWLWRASWDAGPGQFADVDTFYPHMGIDWYPLEQGGTGSRPHAPDRQPPQFLTGKAAGNLLSDPARAFTGSNLQAKGIATLTMRPRTSQLVSAKGNWKDGRWTVVLRRPLEVPEEAGLPLSPGDKVSLALALWDGAAGDRNGQKLISIWHDLELEK